MSISHRDEQCGCFFGHSSLANKIRHPEFRSASTTLRYSHERILKCLSPNRAGIIVMWSQGGQRIGHYHFGAFHFN
ncbi:MAG: hypothetical protein ACRELG_09395, partial [Gemmataceae bacterium]